MSDIPRLGWDALHARAESTRTTQAEAHAIWWERTLRLLGPEGRMLYVGTAADGCWRYRVLRCRYFDLWSGSPSLAGIVRLPPTRPSPPMLLAGKEGHVR